MIITFLDRGLNGMDMAMDGKNRWEALGLIQGGFCLISLSLL